MDPLFIVGIALVVICGTYLVQTQLAAHRRRQSERALVKMLELANDAIENEIRRGSLTAIPVDSPEGRAILERIRMGCECPNCEESRRIAHAEEQKRGEQ